MFVITMIRYNREDLSYKLSFGAQNGIIFVRCKLEFVLTEFECAVS
jgi:hypothetical protein